MNNIIENSFFERWIPNYFKYTIEKRKNKIKEHLRFEHKISDSDLREAFKLFWPYSKGEFIRMYQLNQGNFSAWSNGKRVSLKSKQAVILFIKSLFTPNSEDITYLSLQKTESKEYSTNKFLSFGSVLKLKNYKKIVFFVDMDNINNTFKTFLLLKRSCFSDIPFHIFGFLGKNHYNDVIIQMSNLPFCSVIETYTNTKDAADFSLTSFLFYWLSIMNHKKFTEKISLCIQTRDHFKNEIQQILSHIEHVDVVSNTSYNSDFMFSLYIHHPDIPKFLIEEKYDSFIKILFSKYNSVESIFELFKEIYQDQSLPALSGHPQESHNNIYNYITTSFIRFQLKVVHPQLKNVLMKQFNLNGKELKKSIKTLF